MIAVAFVLLSVMVIGCSVPSSTPGPIRDSEVSETLIVEIDFSSLIQESFRVSPYSKRMAYSAQVGNKWFVVVDGVEDKQYEEIVNVVGERIIFDSPDILHYLAL